MCSAIPAHAAIEGLEIMAPSSPGSGYDQLARAMQTALQDEKLASGIQVVNVAGGGGTVGLAQYITARKRSPSVLVIGFALVGGILTTKAPVTLDQVTPLARLVGEQDLIVVPANSDIKTLADLVAKLKADPGAVSWGGGSIGGFDHVLVGLVAKAVGVDPAKANYVVHAGGGEVLAEILPMAVKMGLDAEKVGAVVNSGTGRSYASEFFIPRILEGNFADGYAMKNAYKDLVSAAELGAKLCIPMPVLAAATATYQMALLKGHGDKDKGGMIEVFEDALKVRFRKNPAPDAARSER